MVSSREQNCFYGDNLEEICGILEDKANEINHADDFFVGIIEEVRKIKIYYNVVKYSYIEI